MDKNNDYSTPIHRPLSMDDGLISRIDHHQNTNIDDKKNRRLSVLSKLPRNSREPLSSLYDTIEFDIRDSYPTLSLPGSFVLSHSLDLAPRKSAEPLSDPSYAVPASQGTPIYNGMVAEFGLPVQQ